MADPRARPGWRPQSDGAPRRRSRRRQQAVEATSGARGTAPWISRRRRSSSKAREASRRPLPSDRVRREATRRARLGRANYKQVYREHTGIGETRSPARETQRSGGRMHLIRNTCDALRRADADTLTRVSRGETHARSTTTALKKLQCAHTCGTALPTTCTHDSRCVGVWRWG